MVPTHPHAIHRASLPPSPLITDSSAQTSGHWKNKSENTSVWFKWCVQRSLGWKECQKDVVQCYLLRILKALLEINLVASFEERCVLKGGWAMVEFILFTTLWKSLAADKCKAVDLCKVYSLLLLCNTQLSTLLMPGNRLHLNFQKNCIILVGWAQLLLRLQQFFRVTLGLQGVICKFNEENITTYTF